MLTSMVKRAFLFSALLSLVSICVVLFTPLDISISNDDGYSPYREEIDQLRPKAERGMMPKEYAYYEGLIDKNNQWFAERRQDSQRFSAKSSLEAWQKKSSYVAPLIMLVWGLIFYYYYRSKEKQKTLYVLTFPVLLTLVGLMSLLEGILISSIVLLIWFWWLIKGRIS